MVSKGQRLMPLQMNGKECVIGQLQTVKGHSLARTSQFNTSPDPFSHHQHQPQNCHNITQANKLLLKMGKNGEEAVLSGWKINVTQKRAKISNV
jgi:hypothetical protein